MSARVDAGNSTSEPIELRKAIVTGSGRGPRTPIAGSPPAGTMLSMKF